jgi:uncharacterized phage infection (PIP) family protein YhgE
MFEQPSSEYRDPYAERFSKDEFGDDNEEDEGIDSEDRERDAVNALEEAKSNLTPDQYQAFTDLIDTLVTHFDKDAKEANKIFDDVNALLAKIEDADEDSLIDDDEDFKGQIRTLVQRGRELSEKKSKTAH